MKVKTSIKILKKDNYLAMINNAPGSLLWRNNYALVNGKKQDLLYNGNSSCAYFVSTILKIFDLIKAVHVTVEGTEKDLQESGWQMIPLNSKMPSGSILVWEKKRFKNPITKKEEFHLHLGFYLGNEKAISNSEMNGFPLIHHYTYDGTRKLLRAYWNPKI